MPHLGSLLGSQSAPHMITLLVALLLVPSTVVHPDAAININAIKLLFIFIFNIRFIV